MVLLQPVLVLTETESQVLVQQSVQVLTETGSQVLVQQSVLVLTELEAFPVLHQPEFPFELEEEMVRLVHPSLDFLRKDSIFPTRDIRVLCCRS